MGIFKMAGYDQHHDRETSLRGLLDELIDVHKNDMLELTSGHLNESKLWNPNAQSRESWISANKPALRLKGPSKLKTHTVRKDYLPPIEANKRFMTEAVMDFMIGPSGGIGFSDRPKNTTPVSPSPEPSFIDKEKKIPSDHHLTQELELPELMLPVYRKRTRKTSRGSPKVKHEFIVTHHAMPTKSDQMKKMREFEDKIIKKKDAEERKLSSGGKEIARIERRLKKRLSNLEARHIVRGVPSFYTLQAYSDCWNDLINYSDIFGNIMQVIKDEYERYISLLLDLQETKNGGLFGQLDLLADQSTEISERVKDEEKEVDNLEKQAMELLNENERLRREKLENERLKEERSKFILPDRSKNNQKQHLKNEKKKDLEEQVEDLHAQIEDQLKTLENLKTERNENYVPIIVCQRLEQCIKETELEIQKLLKQNDYLEKNIDKMEEELEDLLEESGTNEREARMLWMKVNTSQIVDANTKEENS